MFFARGVRSVILALLGAPLFLGCDTGRPCPNTGRPPGAEVEWLASSPAGERQTLDDRAISLAVEHQGQSLAKAGHGSTTRTLLEGLNEGGAGVLLPAPDDTAPAMSLPELYERRRQGVLFLAELYQCTKCPYWHTGATGTAFVLTEDGVCVTNRHMFEEKDKDLYMFAYAADGSVWEVHRLLAVNDEDDIAIFVLGAGRRGDEELEPGSRKVSPIPLASGAPIGTPVALIANPEDYHFLLTSGIVSRRAIRKVSPGAVRPVLTVTCEFGVGSSGGPVMDLAGRAVGMVVSTHTISAGASRRREAQMVIRNCVPADRIADLAAGRVEFDAPAQADGPAHDPKSPDDDDR